MLKEIVEFLNQLDDAGIYEPVDVEDRIWEDAVAEDFLKGYSEKDAVYDKL